jgi:hypothetical protein
VLETGQKGTIPSRLLESYSSTYYAYDTRDTVIENQMRKSEIRRIPVGVVILHVEMSQRFEIVHVLKQ